MAPATPPETETPVNSPVFTESETLLERALRTIPLGAQTFSKSAVQYPRGVSPYFLERGDGCRVWDVDGNEYIDFVNGLCAMTLGYRDPDVDAAVRGQLDRGVIFSLSHPLEMQVAETIVEMVPCAEMVRFGKNGSDATTGAIRLARAFTGRDRIAACGYHGWQDWYIGSTSRNRGVPQATRELTHGFAFNKLDTLRDLFRKFPGEIAAVILEPMNTTRPAPGFLEGVRDLCKAEGALLVFDEMITGFRFADGGAQQLFGVTPDLCSLGKGMANGYPLSAVAGRADVMALMEEVFFSFTMGGEALSLAAALATMEKTRTMAVTARLAELGTRLQDGVEERIARHGCSDFLSSAGHPSWSFLLFADCGDYSSWDIKTLWMQEILARGILSFGTHNMSYAHGPAEIDRLLEVYDEVFPVLRAAVLENRMNDYLRCAPLQPLFRVR